MSEQKITIALVLFIILLIGAGLLMQKYFPVQETTLMPGQVSTGEAFKELSDYYRAEEVTDEGKVYNEEDIRINNNGCMEGVFVEESITVNNTIETHDFPEGPVVLCCREESRFNTILEKTCMKMNFLTMKPTHMVNYEYEDGELINIHRLFMDEKGDYCMFNETHGDYLCPDYETFNDVEYVDNETFHELLE